jgi:hypothetical protein
MLKWAIFGGGGVLFTGLEFSTNIAHVIENWTFGKELYKELADPDRPLLTHLFGASDASETAIVPARHHPFQELELGKLGYDNEVACAASYISALFDKPRKIETVNEIMKIPPGANVVVFGSQVSNFVARDILGDPFDSRIVTRVAVPMKPYKAKGSYSLRWNLCSDNDAPTITRRQYNRDWQYKPHAILDFHSGAVIASDTQANSDLLLVTVIPWDFEARNRIVIFGGLHGAGTLATKKILQGEAHSELRKLEAEIGDHRCFQALFDVKCINGQPKQVSLRDVQALDWSGDSSTGKTELRKA